MSEDFRQTVTQVFGCVEKAVWVITAACGKERGGLVATFVMECSIDPAEPMLIAGLAQNHYTADLVQRSGSFGAHLLASDQADMAWRFALACGRDVDKLGGLATTPGLFGAPLLVDCLAQLDCRVITRYDAGDRWYFWADVVAGRQVRAGKPLGAAALLAAANPEQRAALDANMVHDRQVQRPLRSAWRQSLLE